MNDLRFAFRQLLKNPGFTAVAVLTLALGIGASTAIYSVVNSALLSPVPGRDPERLMQIAEQNKKRRAENFFVGVGPPALAALRDNQDYFADLAWCDGTWLPRKTDEFVQEVMGAEVSPNFFTLLEVKPLLGRTFAPDELTPIDDDRRPIADSVIVIGHSLWKSLFGGDSGVIGQKIKLGGNQFTVIGVMPPHFKFPWGSSEFWLAMEDPRVQPNVGRGINTRILARLKPGTDEQQARVMLDALSQRVVQEFSEHRMYGRDVRADGWGIQIRPMRQMLLNEKLQRTLFGLLGAIAFVLLIVCANIANLMLARTENRQQELAVRAAVGASRLRLLRQLLTESVLLAVLGGLAGLLMTWWSMKLLTALIPDWMPRLQAIQVDGHALAFTLLISLGTGLVFGLAPALRGSSAPLANALKQAGTGTTSGKVWRRYRGALVVIEVALTVVLLAGAGLMIESVTRLLHVNPGFDPENLLHVAVRLPWDRYTQEHKERRNLLLAHLHERLAALPGVTAVGVHKKNFTWKFQFDSQAGPVEVQHDGCGAEESDLFRAMRVPLLAGRYLDKNDISQKYFHENDLIAGITTVVINQTMARLCWPGEDALGKQFKSAGSRSKRRYEVVGIVADTRDYSFEQKVEPTLYRPYQEFDLPGMPPTFIMRTAGDPKALIPAIRKELKAAEPAMTTPDIHVLKQFLYDSTQAHRVYMLYLVAFAGVGLLLAALGIYGVLAYSVTRRTREFGIRMAVGAQRHDVLAMVMTEGARLVVMGVVAGLAASFWLTRLIRHQLFEVSPTEPRVFIAVVLLLLMIALLACFLPARRATRINPMEALRYE